MNDSFVTITLRIPKEFKDKVDRYAAKTNRSRNNYISIALKRALEVIALGDATP